VACRAGSDDSARDDQTKELIDGEETDQQGGGETPDYYGKIKGVPLSVAKPLTWFIFVHISGSALRCLLARVPLFQSCFHGGVI
jgi:hypothetical protein